jgi:hypothetical protein
LFAQPGLKWYERLKALLTDKHTWLSMLYMILQMPLGVIYFTLNVSLISVALSLMATPIIQLFLNIPVIIWDRPIFLPYWALILLAMGGFILLTLTMHMVRGIGWLHGRYAKWILVS